MKRNYGSGFTLIELLIVMAILGVLAVVVLVAINPVQQLARTRDAGRKSAVSQVGRALESFYTTHGGRYLWGICTGPIGSQGTNCNTGSSVCFSDEDDWLTCLRNAGEISTEPGLIGYVVPGSNVCVAAGGGAYSSEQNGLCYTVNAAADRAIVYARLESQSEASKCDAPATRPFPFFVWSTTDGRGGLVCVADVTSPPGPGTISWED